MRTTGILILTCVIVTNMFSQTITKEGEFSSYYFSLKSNKINLTYNSIQISIDNNNVYSKEVSGVKKNFFSPNKKYFMVAAFNYSDKKTDYEINLFVFNNNGNFIDSFSVLAGYDLPNPIFAINDEGVAAAFNPIKMDITLYKDGIEKQILLEKNPEYQTEKSSFLEMNNESAFVLTSEKALSIEEEDQNVKLYKVNTSDFSVDKKDIDYSIPTAINVSDNNVIVSGVKFQNSVPNGNISKMDTKLNILQSAGVAVESILRTSDFYYCKNGNKLFKMNKNLSIEKSFNFDDNAYIKNIAMAGGELAVLTKEKGVNFLYKISSALNVDFKKSLDILASTKIDDMESLDGKLFLYYGHNTLIFK